VFALALNILRTLRKVTKNILLIKKLYKLISFLYLLPDVSLFNLAISSI